MRQGDRFLKRRSDELCAHSALAGDAACLLGGLNSGGERIYLPWRSKTA